MQYPHQTAARTFPRILCIATALLLLPVISVCAGSLSISHSDSGLLSYHRNDDIARVRAMQYAPSFEGKNESGGFIFRDFWDDIVFLSGRPEFFGIVGGLSLSPVAFRSGFRHEEPEFTEMWGKSQLADGIFELGGTMGQGVYQVAGATALWVIGGAAGKESAQSLGSDILRAQAINGILTAAMKLAINRTRPDGSPYAYPSGHTSSAFATAGVLYQRYGYKVGIPALAVASYVGLSRLQENKHYMSDVIAGGILGGYIGYTVAGRKMSGRSISFSPTGIDGAPGLSLSLRF